MTSPTSQSPSPTSPIRVQTTAPKTSFEGETPTLEGVKDSIGNQMKELGHVVPKHPDPQTFERIGKGLGKGILFGAAGFTVALGYLGLMLLSQKDSFLCNVVGGALTLCGIALDIATWAGGWPVRLIILAICAGAGLLAGGLDAFVAKYQIEHLEPINSKELREKMRQCTADLTTLRDTAGYLSNLKFNETDITKLSTKDKASIVFLKETRREMIYHRFDRIKEDFQWQIDLIRKKAELSEEALAQLQLEQEQFLKDFGELENQIAENIDNFLKPLSSSLKKEETRENQRELLAITVGFLFPLPLLLVPVIEKWHRKATQL